MSNLIVKNIHFNGAELMAAQDTRTNKISVGVKWVCEGLGLSEGQIKNERLRIQGDDVLSQGGRNLPLPTNSGVQEVLCIDHEYLPLWLAKISITPKMKKEQPEVAELLVDYQLRAKDVLAEAFLGKVVIESDSLKAKRLEVMERNARAREESAKVKKAQEYTKIAERTNSPVYRNILYVEAANTLAGYALLLPESAKQAEYDAGTVAKRIGLKSAVAVGKLANNLNLKAPKGEENQYGRWVHTKSKHSSKEVLSWVYFDKGVEALENHVKQSKIG